MLPNAPTYQSPIQVSEPGLDYNKPNTHTDRHTVRPYKIARRNTDSATHCPLTLSVGHLRTTQEQLGVAGAITDSMSVSVVIRRHCNKRRDTDHIHTRHL